MFEIKRYEFILEAETPIAHHEAVFGNTAIVAKRRVRMPDGSFEQVPIVSGDAARHGIREAAAYAFLDAAGMLGEGKLSEAALRLLYAGGMVTGSGGAFKLDDYRKFVEVFPPLGLLGGCVSNQVIAGKMTVEDMSLICDETAHRLPPWAVKWLDDHGQKLDTQRAHIEEVQRVRMDPMLSPEKRLLLSAAEQTKQLAKMNTREKAAEDGDALAAADSKSTMMPRRFEAVVQGSLFFWRIEARCQSELEIDTLQNIVGAFLCNAQVGGKRATGHGRIRVLAGEDVKVFRPADTVSPVDFTALAKRKSSLFRDHVAARREQIETFLATVDA